MDITFNDTYAIDIYIAIKLTTFNVFMKNM